MCMERRDHRNCPHQGNHDQRKVITSRDGSEKCKARDARAQKEVAGAVIPRRGAAGCGFPLQAKKLLFVLLCRLGVLWLVVDQCRSIKRNRKSLSSVSQAAGTSPMTTSAAHGEEREGQKDANQCRKNAIQDDLACETEEGDDTAYQGGIDRQDHKDASEDLQGVSHPGLG